MFSTRPRQGLEGRWRHRHSLAVEGRRRRAVVLALWRHPRKLTSGSLGEKVSRAGPGELSWLPGPFFNVLPVIYIMLAHHGHGHPASSYLPAAQQVKEIGGFVERQSTGGIMVGIARLRSSECISLQRQGRQSSPRCTNLGDIISDIEFTPLLIDTGGRDRPRLSGRLAAMSSS